jgi:hypothetical protein
VPGRTAGMISLADSSGRATGVPTPQRYRDRCGPGTAPSGADLTIRPQEPVSSACHRPGCPRGGGCPGSPAARPAGGPSARRGERGGPTNSPARVRERPERPSAPAAPSRPTGRAPRAGVRTGRGWDNAAADRPLGRGRSAGQGDGPTGPGGRTPHRPMTTRVCPLRRARGDIHARPPQPVTG